MQVSTLKRKRNGLLLLKPHGDIFNTSSKDIAANTQFSGYKIYGDDTLSKTVHAAQSRVAEINASLKQERFVLEAPLVFNYVVEKASKKHDILSVAIDLRYTKEAIAFRNQCSLFDQALN
jgi:hypothetical protein